MAIVLLGTASGARIPSGMYPGSWFALCTVSMGHAPLYERGRGPAQWPKVPTFGP